MKIKLNSEEELVDAAKEAIHILNNLRYATKMWHIHYGSYWRDKKKYYEEKADLFLEKLQVNEKTQHSSEIKIDLHANSNTTKKD